MNVLCYTREALADEVYAKRLGLSMHLAYENEKGKYIPLHHNEGILYVKATHCSDGTMVAKSLRNPYLFETVDGNFGVLAVRTDSEGESDTQSDDCVMLWKSTDLVHYQEMGLIRLEESGEIQKVKCVCQNNEYILVWQNE